MTSVTPTKAPPPTPTPAEIAKARTDAKRLIDKARANIVLDHPFFASVMLKKPFVENLSVPTLAVDARGNVYYNPLFVAGLSVGNMVFAIVHELLHYMSGHHYRYTQFIKAHGYTDSKRLRHVSNIAGDYWINDTLDVSKIGEAIPGCLQKQGSADRTYEEIFRELLEGDSGDGNGPGAAGNDDGDPMGDDMDDNYDNLSESEKQEIEAQRKLDVSEAAQVAKAKGKLPGALAKFAAETIEVKTPWHDILERYMVGMTKQDISWTRPNRRYAPSYYLPSMARSPSMGEIVLQIDVSGSISRDEIKYYNGHIKRIVEQCHPERVHVLYTDTAVIKHETFDNPEDVSIQFYSGGGTHMEAGFDYINEKGIAPDVVITLTDGYDSYSKAPDFPVVWCCSTPQPIPYGDVVRFEVV